MNWVCFDLDSQANYIQVIHCDLKVDFEGVL